MIRRQNDCCAIVDRCLRECGEDAAQAVVCLFHHRCVGRIVLDCLGNTLSVNDHVRIVFFAAHGDSGLPQFLLVFFRDRLRSLDRRVDGVEGEVREKRFVALRFDEANGFVGQAVRQVFARRAVLELRVLVRRVVAAWRRAARTSSARSSRTRS